MVHNPVYNRKHEIIISAVTNLDIHDLGRLAATYGLTRLYLITPLTDQQSLARRIISYWVSGAGGKLNPDRALALSTLTIMDDLDQTLADIEGREGVRPRVFITGANFSDGMIGYEKGRELIQSPTPSLLLFGTGWGLADGIKQYADYALEPIKGRTGYNHLSVRSAASIILDRLLA